MSRSSASSPSTMQAQSARTSAASTACAEGTFYNWKARVGGMTVPEAKRLNALEDETAKLKRLLAEQMLDLAAMKELVFRKW